jgi:hypothetical protein
MHINLFIMLNFVLQKANTGVDPHFINVLVPMHRDDPKAMQKLVSNNFNSYIYIYALFVLSVLSSLLCRTDTRRS